MMRLVSPFSRFARSVSPIEVRLFCGWAVALTLVEIVGRRSTSDFLDVLSMFAICLLGFLTTRLHSRHHLQSVASVAELSRILLNSYHRLTLEVGVDLAKSPPLPRKIPPNLKGSVFFSTLIVGGVAFLTPSFPSGARALLSAHFYLLLLALEGLIWTCLALGIAVYSLFIYARLHDWLVERHVGQQPRSIQTEARATAAVFIVMLGSAIVLPLWWSLSAHILLLTVVCIASLLSSPGLELTWRDRSGGLTQVYDGRWMVWSKSVLSLMVAIAATIVAAGECLTSASISPYQGTAPVTVFLGRLFAWTALGGNCVVTYFVLRFAALGMLFHGRGFWSVRRPAVVDVDRRSEIQCRREILRPLQKLFRRAARQKGNRGTGIWITLQHWFVLGLSRDSNSDETFDRETTLMDEIVGPPYFQVFTGRSRRHFQRMTDALKVDLIFVENGVSFQRLVRVLRMMFEIYDVHGGRQRAEEMHFTGLPGVRVLIHNFDLSDTPRHGRANYPEPDYEDVGRARILHVFKDRGETDIETPVPKSWEGTPVLSGV